MYSNCPKCGKLLKADLYLLNDIEDEDRCQCPKCKTIFYYKDNILDITNYADIQNAIRSKCIHLDNNYIPMIKETISGRRCRFCGKFFTYNEYQDLVATSKSKIRNLSNRELYS